MQKIYNTLGKPRNYGPSIQEVEEEKRRTTEERLGREALERAQEEQREVEEAGCRAARWEEWVGTKGRAGVWIRTRIQSGGLNIFFCTHGLTDDGETISAITEGNVGSLNNDMVELVVRKETCPRVRGCRKSPLGYKCQQLRAFALTFFLFSLISANLAITCFCENSVSAYQCLHESISTVLF